MKPFISILLIISFISCNQETNLVRDEEQASEDARDFIDALNRRIEQWYRSEQIDSLISIMSDSIIQLPPNSNPLMGKDSVRAYWSQLFGFGSIDFSLQAQQVKSQGTQAVELGKYVIRFSPDAQSPVPAFEDRGHYVALWEKHNGKWLITWDAPVSTVPMNH